MPVIVKCNGVIIISLLTVIAISVKSAITLYHKDKFLVKVNDILVIMMQGHYSILK